MFVTFGRSHHHAEKVPTENRYVSHLTLLYFVIVNGGNLSFTNNIRMYDKTSPLNLKLYYIHIKMTL